MKLVIISADYDDFLCNLLRHGDFFFHITRSFLDQDQDPLFLFKVMFFNDKKFIFLLFSDKPETL